MKLYTALAAFVLFGCTSKVACDYKPVIVSSASDAIAKELQCTNKDAIAKDVEGAVEKAGICPKAGVAAQAVPAELCDLVGQTMASALAGQVPAAWGCTSAKAKDGLAKVIADACKSAAEQSK